ncbi:MAG: hypothetical protein KatS3mg051_0755 [Anaerolineae bacterium]|nr:MAG: hypothetical protein KatS3mg051_0755 [Anaerolineae bacterium]
MTTSQRPRIVIIGAGFGGLSAVKRLASADVDVLLIDRENFHLFTPLLYQVATSGLEPGEIAYPVRGILRGMERVRFLRGDVLAIDPPGQGRHRGHRLWRPPRALRLPDRGGGQPDRLLRAGADRAARLRPEDALRRR